MVQAGLGLFRNGFGLVLGPFNEKVWQVGFDSRGLFLWLDSWPPFNLIKKQLHAGFRDSPSRFRVLTGYLTSLSIVNIIDCLTDFINIVTNFPISTENTYRHISTRIHIKHVCVCVRVDNVTKCHEDDDRDKFTRAPTKYYMVSPHAHIYRHMIDRSISHHFPRKTQFMPKGIFFLKKWHF